jgi:GMP synthase PP-ATPase subunit
MTTIGVVNRKTGDLHLLNIQQLKKSNIALTRLSTGKVKYQVFRVFAVVMGTMSVNVAGDYRIGPRCTCKM